MANIGALLGKDIGGLPLGVWGVLVIGGVGVGWWILSRNKTASSVTSTSTPPASPTQVVAGGCPPLTMPTCGPGYQPVSGVDANNCTVWTCQPIGGSGGGTGTGPQFIVAGPTDDMASIATKYNLTLVALYALNPWAGSPTGPFGAGQSYNPNLPGNIVGLQVRVQ